MESVQSSTRSASDQFVLGKILSSKLSRRDALRLGVTASVAGILSGGIELSEGSFNSARAASRATITVSGTQWGVSTAYIGATEGNVRFNTADMTDLGINTYRIYGGMSRWEWQDPYSTYGTPAIAQIKADPTIINWTWWDNAMTTPPNGSDYWWSNDCIRGLQGARPTYQSTASDSNLMAITTRDSSGHVYLLVTNSSRGSISTNVDLSALISSGTGTMWQFDSSHMDVIVGNPVLNNGHVVFIVPGTGAVLLQF
jgi:hypothetical protein